MKKWLFLLLMLGSLAYAQQTVTYQYTNHEGNLQSVEATLRKPTGAPNNKALVILHHAGGWSQGTTNQYAEMFSAHGYMTLEPRMFNTRSQMKDSAEHLSQAMDGLIYLAGQPGVDKSQISLIGLSYGSWIAVYAGTDWATKKFTQGQVKFSKIAPLYAVCWLLEQGARKELGSLRNKAYPANMFDQWTHVPLRFFSGSEDDYDEKDPRTCQNFIDAIPDVTQRNLSSVNVYKATHGWDQQKTVTFFEKAACKGKGCVNTNRFDPEVTERVKKDLLRFIEE